VGNILPSQEKGSQPFLERKIFLIKNCDVEAHSNRYAAAGRR
jgi:hypothetical protein